MKKGNLNKSNYLDIKANKIYTISNQYFKVYKNNANSKKLPDGQIEFLVFPAIVCLVFSIELKLKFLIYVQKNILVEEHELDELYKNLDSETQTKLKTKMENLGHNDFDSILQVESKSFVTWRYIYESDSKLNIHLCFLKDFCLELDNICKKYIDASK